MTNFWCKKKKYKFKCCKKNY